MKKRSNFFRKLGMAFPRLMLAVLLAFVISKPLELKIFEREILREIDQKKTQQLQLTKEAVFESFPEIEEKQQQVADLRREILLKEEFRNQKQTEYDWERFGVATSGTSGIPGIGRNARLKEQQLEEAQQDLIQTRRRNLERIDQLEKEIALLYEGRARNIELQQTTIDNYDGFAARIDALGVLTRQSRAIYLANLFIILLFIAVETAPILVKLISPRGPYDDLLEKHGHVFSKYQLEHMTRLEQRTLENRTILEEQSRNALRKEKDVSRTSFREMTDAEIEIARKTIQRWKELELEKLNQLEELQSTPAEKTDPATLDPEKD